MSTKKIIAAIDQFLVQSGQATTNPVDANAMLAQKGILPDREDRPGSPLREILRNGGVPHAYQPNGKYTGWVIPRSK